MHMPVFVLLSMQQLLVYLVIIHTIGRYDLIHFYILCLHDFKNIAPLCWEVHFNL